MAQQGQLQPGQSITVISEEYDGNDQENGDSAIEEARAALHMRQHSTVA